MDLTPFFIVHTENTLKRTRRALREKIKSVLLLPDNQFIKYLGLNKAAFQYILNILQSKLPRLRQANALTAERKLVTFLRFMAEGSYQTGTGQCSHVAVAQITASNIISEVLDIFENNLCSKWITLRMSEQEKSEAKLYFYKKSGIPGVVMCVDGTHVRIIKPCKEHAHLYYNSKGFYSLNVMIICDHRQQIRYVKANCAGSNHDSFVWSSSDASIFFQTSYESGDTNTRVLGDSGYPLLPWLLTPYKAVQVNTPQSRFNKAHSSAHNVVKRTIGVWKNWCRCLLSPRQLHYSPEKVVKIVNVAAALHNIRIYYKVNVEDVVVNLEESEGQSDLEDSSSRSTRQANAIRDEISQNFI